MRHCTVCDQAVPPDALFCTACGARLSGPAPATGATIHLPRPAQTWQPPAAQPAAAGAYSPAPTAAMTYGAQPGVAMAPIIVVQQLQNGPGLLVRAVWFLLLGLWLGLAATILAWGLIVSIIGLPLGLLLLNRLPQIMTLKPTESQVHVSYQPGGVLVRQGAAAQPPFWLRSIYFVIVGWWLSLLWVGAAWFLVGISLGLGLPLAFWMFNRVPAVTTLRI